MSRGDGGPTKPVNVGTIGHVDHGKTTLMAALAKVGGMGPKVTAAPAGGGLAEVLAVLSAAALSRRFTPAECDQLYQASIALRSHGEAIAELIEAADALPEEPNPYTYRMARAKLRAALAKVASNGDAK